MSNSSKSNHPLEDLFKVLGEDLEECTTNELLISENENPIPLTNDSFKEIKESETSRKIAFVDGGDGILEEAPNFLITINRIYFSMFSGKKRISPSTLKSRIEFFSINLGGCIKPCLTFTIIDFIFPIGPCRPIEY